MYELTDIQSRCPPKPFTHSSLSTSHTPTRRSLPPLARYFPSGLTASAHTSSVCPVSSAALPAPFPFPFPLPLPLSGRDLWNVCTCRPVCRSHLTIEPSLPAV